MRIAVIGSGIAGMASAWLLSRQHEVVLFEADSRLGGHTDSHSVEVDGRSLVVDSGFIVYNEKHYPLLTRLFEQLKVASQPTTMSFSVHDEASGVQYNAGNLRDLFCQPTNLFSPRFIGMLADLRRFYREAPAVLTCTWCRWPRRCGRRPRGVSSIFRSRIWFDSWPITACCS